MWSAIVELSELGEVVDVNELVTTFEQSPHAIPTTTSVGESAVRKPTTRRTVATTTAVTASSNAAAKAAVNVATTSSGHYDVAKARETSISALHRLSHNLVESNTPNTVGVSPSHATNTSMSLLGGLDATPATSAAFQISSLAIGMPYSSPGPSPITTSMLGPPTTAGKHGTYHYCFMCVTHIIH